MKHKYKVGDRVVYTLDGRTGNPDLNGWAGKIIGMDNSLMPYTVEFDDSYVDAMEDRRFGGKKGHCWHCAEDHLTLEAENPAQPDRLDGFTPYKFETQKGETEMENTKAWTPEEDAKMAQLKAEGKSAKEISEIIGRSFSAVNTRWSYLQRAKGEPTNPKAPKKQEGELNDLEKVMAEQIKELTERKEQLETEIKDLCDSLEKACAENHDLLEKICKLEDQLVQMDAEATDVKAALAQTEEQRDEAMQDLREVEKRIEKEDHEQIIHFKNLLCRRDAKIDTLQHELVGVYRTALKLAERCLKHSDNEEIPQI